MGLEEVSTHVASFTLEEREPAMCCRLTLTTEVSSTSITALDITATAIIQRLRRTGSDRERLGALSLDSCVAVKTDIDTTSGQQ